jgi:hypothetical protein
MMDILFGHQYPLVQLYDFLSEVIGCSVDRIRIFSIDEFNSLIEELDCSVLDCVCVFSLVRGDCSQMLQLYRYKATNEDIVRRIIDVAFKKNMRCYIPSDSFDGWVYVGHDGAPKHVLQMECDEEDCYLFKLI